MMHTMCGSGDVCVFMGFIEVTFHGSDINGSSCICLSVATLYISQWRGSFTLSVVAFVSRIIHVVVIIVKCHAAMRKQKVPSLCMQQISQSLL